MELNKKINKMVSWIVILLFFLNYIHTYKEKYIYIKLPAAI